MSWPSNLTTTSPGSMPPGLAGPLSSTPATSAPRGGEARLGALADQAALEFRQRTKHMKNQPPLCGRRVEGFGQAAKPDTPDPQGFDGFDQLLHRSRQAVELPHDQRVAAAREFERVMQGRAVCNRTRHLLGENLGAPCFGQRVALQGKVLIYGRNAGIADQHRFQRPTNGSSPPTAAVLEPIRHGPPSTQTSPWQCCKG